MPSPSPSPRPDKEKVMEEGSTSESHSQWSKLCSDILLNICQHHVEPQLQFDFRRRVRAVCASWRSCVPLPLTRLRFPLQVPSFTDDDTSSLLLLETTYYVMSPPLSLNAAKPKGWLIHVTEIKPNTWRLLRPMSSIGKLFHSNPPIRCEINNLLDYQVREVMKTYDLVGDGPDRLCRDVVVSVSNPILTVLLIDNQGQLLVWKLGDTKWTKLRIQAVDSSCHPPTYDLVSWPGAYNYWYFAPFPHGDNCTQTKWLHIATHKGKFYIVDCTSGKVCVIEPPMLAAATSDPMMFKPSIIMPPPPPLEDEDDSCGLPWYRFLVECKGQLYYVIDEWPCTYTNSVRDRGTNTFVLKEGDEDNHWWWERVDDSMELEDQVFFILNGPPFSVPTSDLGFGSGGGWACYASRNPDCCIANSSTKGLEALDRMAYPLYFTCLYKCQLIRLEGQSDRTCIHFVCLSDDEYSSIFFPPPPWLNWHCPANGNAQVSFRDLPFKERQPFRSPPRSNGPKYRVFDSANEIDNIRDLESETYR